MTFNLKSKDRFLKFSSFLVLVFFCAFYLHPVIHFFDSKSIHIESHSCSSSEGCSFCDFIKSLHIENLPVALNQNISFFFDFFVSFENNFFDTLQLSYSQQNRPPPFSPKTI